MQCPPSSHPNYTSGIPKRGSHALGGLKLEWHISGSSFGMNPRPSAISHSHCSSPALNPPNPSQPRSIILEWELGGLYTHDGSIHFVHTEVRARQNEKVTSLPSSRFSVSICSTLKFICSSDDEVSRLLITENDTSYKSNVSKNRWWCGVGVKADCLTRDLGL